MENVTPPTTRLLRREEVEHVTGLSRSTIYDAMAAGRFPRPVPLTATARAWPEDEILAWIAGRLAARDSAEAA
jgi:prophage regulatory protein